MPRYSIRPIFDWIPILHKTNNKLKNQIIFLKCTQWSTHFRIWVDPPDSIRLKIESFFLMHAVFDKTAVFEYPRYSIRPQYTIRLRIESFFYNARGVRRVRHDPGIWDLNSNPWILNRKSTYFVGNPLTLIGNPMSFIRNSLIFIGNPLICRGNPLIFIGNPLICIGIH